MKESSPLHLLNGSLSTNSPLIAFERAVEGAKVLVVTNFWPHPNNPTYGIFAKRQVDSLVALGIHSDVLIMRGHVSRGAYPAAAWRLARASVAPQRYQLVHAHGGEAGVFARSYLGAPLIVTYYGSDLLGIQRGGDTLAPMSRIRRLIVRQSARAAAATVTQSRQMEETLPAAARRRNRVIPNGIDRDVFHPIDRTEAREELGWPPSERVALFAGDPRLPVKRFWLAEAACREASERIGPVRLTTAWGTPPERMPLVLNAADCLLLTSSSEGSPNVVKEALTCGLRVVTTRVGDVDDLLGRVEPSWVCGDQPEELGRAVADCLAGGMRSNGWETGAWLSLEAVAEQVELLYDEVAPGLTG